MVFTAKLCCYFRLNIVREGIPPWPFNDSKHLLVDKNSSPLLNIVRQFISQMGVGGMIIPVLAGGRGRE